ncbi:hypothetical protein JRO89_XS12G0042900 [Xanthoceras sorbifolium]|uniref:Uncharacterized protein n=1 Tax=Xanthoceras sorbifolium TaxID=99658 RepID=A0ABQ8HB02_9ROSI|nr:hypothetical protein JRO89_XS12G0042900 [Xanthoceras sorbifolium]
MSIPEEESSPLATVDDIHRRLLRPPSLHSPIEDAGGRSSSQLKADSTPIILKKREAKQRETTKRKLEDYLDPVLLRAISSEIRGQMKKNCEITNPKPREIQDFEWPVDELKVLVEDSRIDKRNKEAVNLGDDIDLIHEVDGGVADGDGEFYSTPFQRFERTALRRFNG